MSVSQSQTLPHNQSLPNLETEYPPLQKKDTLYYRKLDSSDFPMKKFKQLDTKRDYSLNNYTLDIDGAVPKRYGLYNQKPPYHNSNADIEKSSPSVYNPYINKPNYNLSNKDIKGSIPQGHHVFQNERHLNPLCPDYKLPSFKQKEVEEYKNRFIRDNIDVSDIEGASPKKYLKWSKRDNINIYNEKNDDDYKFRNQQKKGDIYDYLDYRDVYSKQKIEEKPKLNMHNEVIQKRHTNPLDPVYHLSYRGGEKYTIGEIEKSKPQSFSIYHTEKVGKGNSTDDIEGAQPDTKTTLEKFELKWKRPLVHIAEDIIGAKHDTKIRGIVTKRKINPLVPKYQYPGVREERERIANNRYGNNNFNNENNDIAKSMEVQSGNNLIDNNNLNNNNVAQSQIINNNNGNLNENNVVNENLNNSSNNDNLNNNVNNLNNTEGLNNNENVLNNGNNMNNNGNNLNNSNNNLNNNNNNLNNSNNNLNNSGNNLNNSVNSDYDNLTIEELKKLPYYENVVNFDKEKYKRPEIYRTKIHDKALIASPPNKNALEDYKKSKKIPMKPPQRQMPGSLEDRDYIRIYYNPYEHQLDKFMKKNN